MERLHVDRSLDAAPLLSSAQRWLWFLQQTDPSSAAYNSPMAFRLRGPVDLRALRWSLDRILERHEVLRTAIVSNNGTPTAVILPALGMPFDSVALEGAKESGADEDQLRQAVSKEARRPFDLAHECLIRACLFRLNDRDHVLLIVTHHVASDGWSHRVLLDELATLYNGQRRNASGALPSLSLQYRDFAAWEQRRLAAPTIADDRSFWKRTLAGAPPLLELPTDFPRPAQASFAGMTHRFVMPPTEVERLRQLTRRQGVTMFMALLAGFATVLSRWTHRTDLVVGSPAGARPQREMEALVGCFINTLALRLDLSGGPSFIELIKRVRRSTIEGMTHAAVPFDLVAQDIGRGRSASYSPVVQTMFAFQNASRQQLALDGLGVEEFVIEMGISKLDLTLDVSDGPTGLDCALEFKTDLFRLESMQRLAGHWRTVLAGAVDAPDRSIDDLPMLTDGELAQLRTWNDTDAPFDDTATIHGMFERQAALRPADIAITCGDIAISYRDLETRSNQYARAFTEAGLQPAARAAVFLDRSVEAAAVLLAVLKCGAAYVPLDASWPCPRVEAILRNAAPALLITHSDLSAPLAAGPWRRVEIDRLDVRSLAPERLDRPVAPADLAYVLFTSGSTGVPKGVLMPHGAVCNHIQALQLAFPIRASDRLLSHTSFAFDVSVGELFGALAAGATVVMLEPGSPADVRALAQLIADKSVTVIDVVPPLLRALLDEPAFAQCRSLRQVHCGAETLPVQVARRFTAMFSATLINFYGPTESCIDVTAWPVALSNSDHAVPIGHPIANTQIHILDGKGRQVPVGVPGEIYIGGAGLAQGYLGDERRTAESFVPNHLDPVRSPRLYRTGDWGRFREDGAIDFLGRRDRQVKVRGVRVEIAEIESALDRIPGLRECAVLTRNDVGDSIQLAAFVAGSDIEEVGIRAQLSTLLPAAFVPDIVVVLPQLPRTAAGKIDVAALQAMSIDTDATVKNDGPPRGEIEEAVAAAFADLLHRPRPSRHQDFFDLGGHSLLAAQLVSRIRDELNVDLPLGTLFQASSVAALAQAVTRSVNGLDTVGRGQVPPAVLSVNPNGHRTPVFFLHAAVAGDAFYARQIARRQSPEQPFFSLSPLGLDGRPMPPSIEDMAAEYVRIIRTLRPTGPYVLGGFCMSGPVAFEVAQQLTRSGESVPLVFVIESTLWNSRLMPRLLGRVFDRVCALALVPRRRRVDFICRLKQLRGATLPEPSDLSALRERVEQHYDRIRTAYVPRTSNVPLISYWTNTRGSNDIGWQHVSQTFASEVISGDHTTCLTLHLRAFVSTLEERLASLNAGLTQLRRPTGRFATIPRLDLLARNK